MIILMSAAAGSAALSTLANASFSSGLQQVVLGAASNPQGEFIAAMRQTPAVNFATRKIDALEASVLGDGALYFATAANGGSYGAPYVSLTGASGLVLTIPRQISWSPGQPAQMSVDQVFLSSDGSTHPITVGSLQGDSTAEADVWVGAGDGVSQITVDFGYTFAPIPDGNLFPQEMILQSERPVISITQHDEAALTQTNVEGEIATLSVEFSKLADGGVRGASRTYSLTGLLTVEGVQGGRPSTVVKRCVGKGGLTIS